MAISGELCWTVLGFLSMYVSMNRQTVFSNTCHHKCSGQHMDICGEKPHYCVFIVSSAFSTVPLVITLLLYIKHPSLSK